MTTVFFVRHAEPNTLNHDDLTRELSEKGWKDRLLVTDFLQSKHIDVLLSSPYRRAVDTISDFARKSSLNIELEDDFRERRIGEWLVDFDGFTRRQWLDFSYKLTGGESLQEVQKRNIHALNRVLRQYSNKNIAIGSHGTALSTVIHYFDSSFGYDDFMKIKDLMPWVVQFDFEGRMCQSIRFFDLFETSSS